ncbi:MAG: dihydropteroate synthase [Chloroflexota bacterium]|nr:dihydropteroate synthase [Chloroflexota bacterium]
MPDDKAQQQQQYNARLVGPEQSTVRGEIERVGALWQGQEIVGRKSRFLHISLSGLTCVGANVLKQEMLARGGDCAVHRDCLTLERETTSVLLTGTRAQYDDLLAKLPQQAFGLPEAARQLDALLLNIEALPTPVQAGPYTLPIGKRTLIMGIINVTDDSFSGDSLGTRPHAALEQALRMKAEGADILDVGGMSTRPGSEPISIDDEIGRVRPVIELLQKENIGLPISIDTYRAAVASAAMQAGAHIINDITALRDDPELGKVAARHEALLALMHIQGTPQTMQQNPEYGDLLGEVILYLREAVDKAVSCGVNKSRVWIDPGIGFGKTLDHNLELLRRLGELKSIGCAVLVGTSRKGFIGKLLQQEGQPPPPPEQRATGTGATLAVSIANRADIVRVHDVAQAREVVRVADAIVRPSGSS